MRVERQRLLTAALSLYGLALAAHPLDEADTFFQLSMGRAVLRAGSRVVPEPTAFFDFSTPAVAFEWLWSVLSYAVFELGGYALLTWLGCALSALACYSAAQLAQRTRADESSPWLVGAISVFAVCGVMCRVSVRPELAVLCVLPWYVVGARAYAERQGRQRLLLGMVLALGCVLWAQLHASFVLCPLIFVLSLLRREMFARGRSQLQTDGLVLLLLLAAQLSSPFGALIGERISVHAAGDAPRYISDMARPTWAALDPFSAPNMAAYFLLIALCSAGMLIERRWYVRELGLLLLGAALFATANRFIAEAVLLAVPLANQGARGLSQHFAGRALNMNISAVAAAAVVAALTAVQVQQLHRPLGHWGPAEHALALHAADAPALKALPKNAPVLTDYPSSAVVGFVGRDRLRTFVDGRTPSYFDATDFAVAREIGRDKLALFNGLHRYNAHAAVFRRDSEACAQLASAPGWSVALVEPLYTTFVEAEQGTAETLTQLRPCGMSYFSSAACSGNALLLLQRDAAGVHGEAGASSGAALRADIARVRDAGAREFADFLDAARVLRCGAAAAEQAKALARVRELEASAEPFSLYYRRVLIEGLLRAGDFQAAEAHMLRALSDGDASVVSMLQLEAAGGLPLAAARHVLTQYVERTGDDADPGVRAALAEICARAGDQECTRFQATRAAVRGRSSAALSWLAAHHEDERVRRDAQRWLDVLGPASAAAAR